MGKHSVPICGLLLIGGACYQPSPPTGARCSTLSLCPTGLSCSSQGFCTPDGSDEIDALVVESIDAQPIDARDCPTPTADCWDIQATFTATDFEINPAALQIFGQVAIDGNPVYAFLDSAEDDTFTTVVQECPFNTLPRSEAWDIERKVADANTVRIVVRGSSDIDCGKGQPSNAGNIQVNAFRGWAITEVVRCDAAADNDSNGVTIPTFCTVNSAAGTIEWASGSMCVGCCACADGATVDIEVIVSRVSDS